MAATTTVSSGLAARYAAALFELADEAKELDTVAADLGALKVALVESADLRGLIRSPLIGRTEQGQAMEAVLGHLGASDLTRRFVGVITANRRLFALPQMVDAFLDDLARRRGEVTAEVTAAMALSEAQVAALDDQLKRIVGAKVSLKLAVDPGLLGGMIVKVGSTMIDSSLRTKMNKMQLAMKGIA